MRVKWTHPTPEHIRRKFGNFLGSGIQYLLSKSSHCTYCGNKVFPHTADADHGFRLEHIASTDHRIPKIRGGKNDRSNCVLSCQRCNYAKNDMTDKEFRYMLWTGTLHPDYIAWVVHRTMQMITPSFRKALDDAKKSDNART